MLIAVWAAVLHVLTTTSAAAQSQTVGQQPTEYNEYIVGAGDVLAITVWNQMDLSGKFTIDADGDFVFPLIGRVTAGGMTLRAIEAELLKRLADGYFRKPQLTVAMSEYHSQRVFVVGEVRAAGSYPLRGNMTVLEVLALAGASTTGATSEVIIVRPKNGEPSRGPILPGDANNADVETITVELGTGGAPAENVALKAGDTVFVPRAQDVFVYGQVRAPGAYAISRRATVMQVVALAGGATDRGAVNRIKILRVVNGKRVEIRAKLSDTVEPGDTVVVPERFL